MQYRPRVTYRRGRPSGRPARGPPTCAGTGSANAIPTAPAPIPAPAFALVDAGLERRLGESFVLRGDVHDLTDRRAEFLAGYPTPGRSVSLTLTVVVP